MAAHVPRQEASAEIVVGAHRISDNQADLLPAVEILGSVRISRSGRESAAK
jgi:hypothetical protein